MSTLEPRYQIKSVGVEAAELTVLWGDGHMSRFHPMWLRHQCECDICGSSLDAIRGIFQCFL